MEPHTERALRPPVALEVGDCVPLELWIGREKLDVRIDAEGIRFRQAGAEVLLRWSDALGLAVLESSRARGHA